MSRSRLAVLSIASICVATMGVILAVTLPRLGDESPSSTGAEPASPVASATSGSATCDAALVLINVNSTSLNFAGMGKFPDAWRTCNDRDILAATVELLSAVRAAEIPIIYVYGNHQIYDEEENALFPVSIEPQEGDVLMARPDYVSDVVSDTDLLTTLDVLGVRELLIAGLHTGHEITRSARQAASLGYDVTVVADAHSGGEPAYASQYNDYWPSEGVSVQPMAELDFDALATGK